MARLDTDRQNKLEPERLLIAKESIEAFGYDVAITADGKSLKFLFKDHVITMYPYSGWHTGKTIKDGRGLQKLLTQINPTKQ